MKKQTLDTLAAHNIVCHAPAFDKIRFGFGGSRPIVRLEEGVHLREGAYDVESIGAFTYMGGSGAVFRHVRHIGRFCSIAGGIMTGQVEHPLDMLSTHPIFYSDWRGVISNSEALNRFSDDCADMLKEGAEHAKAFEKDRAGKIDIGNDVWIGYGAYIRRGVRIGDGAVIASKAVVTKDVEPYSIVGGVSAKVLKLRFEDKVVERLLKLKWWDYGLAAMNGVNFCDVDQALDQLQSNIESLTPWQPSVVLVHPDETIERL